MSSVQIGQRPAPARALSSLGILIGSGDTGVAQEVTHRLDRTESRHPGRVRDNGCRTAFRDALRRVEGVHQRSSGNRALSGRRRTPPTPGSRQSAPSHRPPPTPTGAPAETDQPTTSRFPTFDKLGPRSAKANRIVAMVRPGRGRRHRRVSKASASPPLRPLRPLHRPATAGPLEAQATHRIQVLVDCRKRFVPVDDGPERHSLSRTGERRRVRMIDLSEGFHQRMHVRRHLSAQLLDTGDERHPRQRIETRRF